MSVERGGITVGVLALQGAYAAHIRMLEGLGVSTLAVRYPEELDGCDAIVLPGGESTTMTLLLERAELFEPLQRFVRERPAFGTCAGAILLGRQVDDERVRCLEAVELSVERNAYGRQVDSFRCELDIPALGPEPFAALFIRAPRFGELGEGVEVLAQRDGEAVLVREGARLVCSFHPEITGDSRIHSLFLGMVEEAMAEGHRA